MPSRLYRLHQSRAPTLPGQQNQPVRRRRQPRLYLAFLQPRTKRLLLLQHQLRHRLASRSQLPLRRRLLHQTGCLPPYRQAVPQRQLPVPRLPPRRFNVVACKFRKWMRMMTTPWTSVQVTQTELRRRYLPVARYGCWRRVLLVLLLVHHRRRLTMPAR